MCYATATKDRCDKYLIIQLFCNPDVYAGDSMPRKHFALATDCVT